MKTLADAWKWYQATRQSLGRMLRLGDKHWKDPSLENASLWKNDDFRMLEAEVIVGDSTTSLAPIADLAIVVLFSVFESRVRDYLVERITSQAADLTDPILKEAAEDAIQGVKEGSFYRRVLDPLKKQDSTLAPLATKVDQVRDYRNWVAHGRRNEPTNNVTPEMAYTRLNEFLAALGISSRSEEEREQPSDESAS